MLYVSVTIGFIINPELSVNQIDIINNNLYGVSVVTCSMELSGIIII